jgi:hypothetical protein
MTTFAVLNNKIVNYIGLRGNNVIRFPDYPVTVSLHKLRDCVMYDEIEQLILKNIHPKIKFYNHYDLEILKERHYRSALNEDIRNDWNQSIRFEK